MGTPTYTALANLTLSSSAASVTFSSISQAYRDLVLVVQATNSTGAWTLRYRINGDTASSYSLVSMRGNGSAAESFSQTNTNAGFLTFSDMTNYNVQSSFFDYSTTDKHKSILARGNEASTYSEALATRWPSTSAITTILVYPASGNFATGSTFALYGIAA